MHFSLRCSSNTFCRESVVVFCCRAVYFELYLWGLPCARLSIVMCFFVFFRKAWSFQRGGMSNFNNLGLQVMATRKNDR